MPKKRIAQQLGFGVKTGRRYLAAARVRGVEPAHGLSALEHALVDTVVTATEPGRHAAEGRAIVTRAAS